MLRIGGSLKTYTLDEQTEPHECDDESAGWFMLPGPPCAPIVLVIQILMRSWMATVLIGGESVRSMWQRLRVRKTPHRNTDSGSKYILTQPPKTTRTLAVSIT